MSWCLADVARLGVVVPARDEQQGLGRCLRALDRAAAVAALPLDVVVVLDSCRDDSAAVVAATAETLTCRINVVTTDAGSVGTARRLGMERLFEIVDPSDDWVATTDADSEVPPFWFRRQLAHRSAGAAMVAGTVHVMEWEDRFWLRPHWRGAYVADGHRHVHGANLSFQASTYRRVGGFVDVTYDEDVALVSAFAAAGETIAWATDVSVATSARSLGRAPGGFAAHLNELAGAIGRVRERDAAVPLLDSAVPLLEAL